LLGRKAQNAAELKAELKAELVQERARSMVNHAKILMLRELYVACNDSVPEALVEDELTRRWREQVGEALIRQGVSVEEQKASLQRFSSDINTYAEARRSVWEVQVLEAIAALQGLEVDENELARVLAGLPDEELRRGGTAAHLRANPALHKGLIKGLRMHRATMLLLAATRITFDAPPTPADKAYVPLMDKETAAKIMPKPAAGKGDVSRTDLKRPPSRATTPAAVHAPIAADDDRHETTAVRGLKRPTK
jgi:hypothetical protein